MGHVNVWRRTQTGYTIKQAGEAKPWGRVRVKVQAEFRWSTNTGYQKLDLETEFDQNHRDYDKREKLSNASQNYNKTWCCGCEAFYTVGECVCGLKQVSMISNLVKPRDFVMVVVKVAGMATSVLSVLGIGVWKRGLESPFIQCWPDRIVISSVFWKERKKKQLGANSNAVEGSRIKWLKFAREILFQRFCWRSQESETTVYYLK